MKRKAATSLYGTAKRVRFTGTGPLGRRLGRTTVGSLVRSAGPAALRGLGTLVVKASPYLGAASMAYDAYRAFKGSSKKGTRRNRLPAVYRGKFRGKMKRPSKSAKIIARNGITLHGEQGGSITSQHVVFVGHTTVATRTIQYAASLALLKKFIKYAAQYDVTDVDQVFPDLGIGLSGACKIEAWATSAKTGNAFVIGSYTITPNVTTLAGLGQSLTVNMNSMVTGSVFGVDPNTYYLSELRLIQENAPNVVVHARMNVYQVKVDLEMSSTLKLQNESKIGTNTSTDAVDAVALEGRSYVGKNNHLVFKGPKPLGAGEKYKFIGTSTLGIIAPVHDEHPWTAFNEPPPVTSFFGAQKEGKVVIQPGNINTSTLKTKYSVFYNKLFKDNTPWIGNATPSWASLGTADNQKYFGSVKLFALEKMVHQTTDVVSIAYQVDYRVSATVKNFSSGYTNVHNIARDIVDIAEDP